MPDTESPAVERFRKRPLEVEMMLWDGTLERLEAIQQWIRTVTGGTRDGRATFIGPDPAELWVAHSHSFIHVPVGHRIAREADGNGFYPISPAAIAETFDPAPEPLELIPAEQAAMQTDPHVAFCRTPLGQCVACMAVYRKVKKVIAAVEPVIAEQVTKPLKERLEALEREQDEQLDLNAELVARLMAVRALETSRIGAPAIVTEGMDPVAFYAGVSFALAKAHAALRGELLHELKAVVDGLDAALYRDRGDDGEATS